MLCLPVPLAHACLLAAAGLLAACQPADKAQPAPASATPAPSSTVLATLNGEPLDRALFDQLLQVHAGTRNPYDAPTARPAASAPKASVNRQQVFDELLDIELLAQKARELGVDQLPAVVAEHELLTKTLLAQQLVRQTIAGIPVSQAELQALYEVQVPPHEFQIAQTLLPSRTAADALIARLRSGQRMGEDTAWLMASQMPREVLDTVRTLKPGEVSPQPLAVGTQWQVIQLVALRPTLARPSLETATAWLHPQIVRDKVQAQQQAWLQEAHVQKSPTP